MTELSTQDGGKRRNSAPHAAVLVSGYELARHFGCSRQNVDLLATQGVIERRADGKFDQDVSRLKYLTHLRAEHRRSPRAQADADYVKVKTEMLQTRLMEKRRELVLQIKRADACLQIDAPPLRWIVRQLGFLPRRQKCQPPYPFFAQSTR